MRAAVCLAVVALVGPALTETMHAEAVRLGAAVVEKEAELDRRFAEARIDDASLRESVAVLARLQGELRATHLVAHVGTRSALSPAQVDAYMRLRGYAPGRAHAGHVPHER